MSTPDVIWIASYMKSGSTWMRAMLFEALQGGDDPLEGLRGTGGMASSIGLFSNNTLLAGALLRPEDVEDLRPWVHRMSSTREESSHGSILTRFVKTHDAWTLNAAGLPLLGGAEAAQAAILLLRDPRAVAPSWAHHTNLPIDKAIDFMGSDNILAQDWTQQMPQHVLNWSDHQASWLEQSDIPVIALRYEDTLHDPAGQLFNLLARLGLPVTEEAAKRAAEATTFDKFVSSEAEKGFREAAERRTFFRKGRSDAWLEELTAAQIARIEKDHGTMMARLGYQLVTGKEAVDPVAPYPSQMTEMYRND